MGNKNSGKPKHDKWSQADKINGVGVLIAVLGLLLGVGLPGVLHLVSYLNRAQASIIQPVDNARVPDNTFGAHGSADNIPPDYDLWLILRSGVEGRWYPVQLLHVVKGIWQVGEEQMCPTPGLQELIIYMVPDSEEGQLFAYQRSAASKSGQGIDSIPPDSVVKATAYVQVPVP
jgi:hypothetical protein